MALFLASAAWVGSTMAADLPKIAVVDVNKVLQDHGPTKNLLKEFDKITGDNSHPIRKQFFGKLKDLF